MSKRVTKAMAHVAAVELANKAYSEKIEKAKADFKAFGLELYHKYIPEALPYLNFTECTALVPCLDNLRNKLK